MRSGRPKGMRFAVGLAFILCACGPRCPKPVIGFDGGVASCVQATDCPRPSNMLVCGSTLDATYHCVGCESLKCVRYDATCTP